MNSNRELRERLLHLYPIASVKEYFGITGSREDVIDDISTNRTQADIFTFAFNYFFETRQNIHLYHTSRPLQAVDINETFPLQIVSRTVVGSKMSLFFLIKVTYNVYVGDPPTIETLDFLQPALVIIDAKNITIHFTKLKKNIQDYFNITDNPKPATILNDENVSLQVLVDYFSGNFNFYPTDINKGTKYLWEHDWIDCVKISYRDKHSAEQSVMDENMTFKQKYPTRYSAIIKTPLGSTIFNYLKDDDYFCEVIKVDPTAGTINIAKSPKTLSQIQNVIATILRHN